VGRNGEKKSESSSDSREYGSWRKEKEIKGRLRPKVAASFRDNDLMNALYRSWKIERAEYAGKTTIYLI